MSSTQDVYTAIIGFVSKGNYSKAYKLLNDLDQQSNDIYTERAAYVIYGKQGSPYFDKEKAIACLNKLIKMDDSWSVAEKGRCCLMGLLSPVDTYEAENLFIKVKDQEPIAAFLLASIYADGLHITDSGHRSYDYDAALELYRKIIGSNSKYQNPSKLGFCKIMITKGGMNISEKKEVFSHLVYLNEHNVDGAYALYITFLLVEAEREFIDHAVAHGTGHFKLPDAYNIAKNHFANLITLFSKR